MQMLNQQKVSNKVIKKSHKLIFGSFLVFIGIIYLSWNHLLVLREKVYSDMMLLISDSFTKNEDVIEDVPNVDILPSDNNDNVSPPEPPDEPYVPPVIDYSKYLGVLEIPRISLKRGFYDVDSKYNDIQYNVSVVRGSTMPDVEKGNLILILPTKVTATFFLEIISSSWPPHKIAYSSDTNPINLSELFLFSFSTFNPPSNDKHTASPGSISSVGIYVSAISANTGL